MKKIFVMRIKGISQNLSQNSYLVKLQDTSKKVYNFFREHLSSRDLLIKTGTIIGTITLITTSCLMAAPIAILALFSLLVIFIFYKTFTFYKNLPSFNFSGLDNYSGVPYIDIVSNDVKAHVILRFIGTTELSTFKDFKLPYKMIQKEELLKILENETIKGLFPEFIQQAENALEKKEYEKAITLLEKFHIEIMAELKKHNEQQYNTLRKEYENSISLCEKIEKAAKAIKAAEDRNLQKFWEYVGFALICNEINIENYPSEDASAEDIRAWFNNPDNKKALESITTLDVICTPLTAIPPEISNLINLTKLNLSLNKISKIENLDNLTNLTYLRLDSNQISQLEGLDNLTNLKHISFAYNNIYKIEGLNNLTKLTKIDFFDSGISNFEVQENETMQKLIANGCEIITR